MYRRLMVFVCLSVVVLAFGITAAQDEMVLTPDSGQAGSLSAENPSLNYTFTGSAGDLVTMRVVSLTAGMTLTASILAPSEQQIGTSESGLLGEAMVSARLPEGGTYTSRVEGTPGDFVILLDVLAAAQATALIPYVPVTARLSPESSSQVYSFDASPSIVSSLELRSNSDDRHFSANLYDLAGRLTGFVSSLPDACLSIPIGEGTYTLVIAADDAETEFDIIVLLRGQPCDSGEVESPSVTAENDDSSADVCRATAGGMVNLRNGPGTEYAIIGGLNNGQSLTVLGTSGTGWYLVDTENVEQTFISASLVYISGSCANLPVLENGILIPASDATPTPSPTPIPSATAAPVQPTPTFAAVASVATAFPAADYTLTIPLDSTVSLEGSVSGDTEVQVNYDVLGMNESLMLSGGRAQLTVVISCSGTGTENIEILSAGQTYACEETIFDQEVTDESSSGGILISVNAEQETDVQWELTGTAVRAG